MEDNSDHNDSRLIQYQHSHQGIKQNQACVYDRVFDRANEHVATCRSTHDFVSMKRLVEGGRQ